MTTFLLPPYSYTRPSRTLFISCYSVLRGFLPFSCSNAVDVDDSAQWDGYPFSNGTAVTDKIAKQQKEAELRRRTSDVLKRAKPPSRAGKKPETGENKRTDGSQA